MIRSAYLESWPVNNSGLLNLSDLDTYLSNPFHDEGIQSLSVSYGGGVFPNLVTILPRYNNS